MKSRLVIWGENGSNEKILIAIELVEKDNKVQIYTFPHKEVTEAFYQEMLDKWREGAELEFPADHQKLERPLTMSDSLLPDDIKAVRPDLITRAQAEWHFIVLSSKLYDMYRTEVDELKDKIDGLSNYDDMLWNEAKSFWVKVQDQMKEQNLFKEHGSILKERVNNLFTKLKSLRSEYQKDFEVKSSEVAAELQKELAGISERIEQGLGLKPIFEELKQVQNKYYKQDLTKKDRKTLWDSIEAAFQLIKSKKSPENRSANYTGGGSRVKGRYDGLLEAIKKMEDSIAKDVQEKEFQNKKVSESGGQLEMQIRQAKIKMIEERINSKNEKLTDMYATKTMLEGKMEGEKKREEERNTQAKKEEIKETIKMKIAEDIKANAEKFSGEDNKLVEAAEELNNDVNRKRSKPASESLLGAVTATIGESVQDLADTVSAIVDVVEDKIDDAIDAVKGKSEEE